MDGIITIGLFILGTILTIIGSLINNAYKDIKNSVNDFKNDFQKHSEYHGKLKGKLELLEQEHKLKYQMMQETTQQEITNMALQLSKLSDAFGEMIKCQMKEK